MKAKATNRSHGTRGSNRSSPPDIPPRPKVEVFQKEVAPSTPVSGGTNNSSSMRRRPTHHASLTTIPGLATIPEEKPIPPFKPPSVRSLGAHTLYRSSPSLRPSGSSLDTRDETPRTASSVQFADSRTPTRALTLPRTEQTSTRTLSPSRATSDDTSLNTINWPPSLPSSRELKAARIVSMILHVALNEDTPPAVPLLVPVKVNGKLIAALLDTGSSMTLISSTIAPHFAPITPPQLAAVSISGHQLAVLGVIDVHLSIGQETRRHLVHVLKDAPHDCVLGTDLLQKFGLLSLDLERGHLYINTESIPLGTAAVTGPWDVHLQETMSIPARAEVRLPGTMKPKGAMVFHNLGDLEFEPNMKTMIWYDIAMATAVVRLRDDTIPSGVEHITRGSKAVQGYTARQGVLDGI